MTKSYPLNIIDQGHDSYPCAFPFSQLYALPREKLFLSFCSYHPGIAVEDQAEYYLHGTQRMDEFMRGNATLKERRRRFLNKDFSGAGCSPDCYWLNKWKMTGNGFTPDDFRDANGDFKMRRMWLSVGPDCNITCRYCLEPQQFVINYNTCDATVMDVAADLIRNGGSVLLTGGEPFLPKFRLLQTLESLARLDDVTGWFEIHTNGMYLKAPVRELVLRSPVRTINVSMDTLRPELFEYLRRGAKFDLVWGNVRSLVRDKSARGLLRPDIVILCAVMKSTFSHICETVDSALAEGLTISLNALFQGYFSPDFCRAEGLHNLSLKELQGLAEDLRMLDERYASTGHVQSEGLAGQVDNLINAKRDGRRGPQVVLGGGGEAPRKGSVVGLLRKGQVRAATRIGVQTARNGWRMFQKMLRGGRK